MRGKSALFRLVARNGFAHFVRKVFARRKLATRKVLGFCASDREYAESEGFTKRKTLPTIQRSGTVRGKLSVIHLRNTWNVFKMATAVFRPTET